MHTQLSILRAVAQQTHSNHPQTHTLMANFYKYFTWVLIIIITAVVVMKVQDIHYTGGSTNGIYNPNVTATGSKTTRHFQIFRVDNTKPDVKKLKWETPTTANGEKWTVEIDDGEVEKFDSIEELNDRVEKYGLHLRPLTTLESIWKWCRSWF